MKDSLIGRGWLCAALTVSLLALGGIAPVNAQPTPEPTAQPTAAPTAQATVQPTTQPTAVPTLQPTLQPTPQPTLTTIIRLPDGAVCQVADSGSTQSFNGQPVTYNCGAAPNGGTTVILGAPTFSSDAWSITVGIVDGSTLRSSQTLRVVMPRVELVDDTVCNLVAGEPVSVNGEPLSYTCGRPEEGLLGTFNTTNALWTANKVVIQQSGDSVTVQQRETLGIRETSTSTAPAPSAQATSLTLPDGTQCQFSGTGATITFQGQRANYTCSNPAQVVLGTPVLQNGVWVVTVGNVQNTSTGPTIVSSTQVEMDITRVNLLDGSTCSFAGNGATISIDGLRLNYTCGDPSVGLFGDFNTSQPLWTAEKITFQQTASGPVAQSRATVGIGSVVGAVPSVVAPPPAPVPTPMPAPSSAPPQTRDERFYIETGFRVGNDSFWSFFQSRGAIETFGFPVSRVFNFLGCPVQIYQRLIMQQCGAGAPVALLNLLDPELFPYTRVNGSTFPAPDDALKDATPSVSSPDYDVAIMQFVRDVAPDEWNGQPVAFQQTFFNTGGLEIWGAPISNPAYDPNNVNFIYQRYQRGIMHYAAGQGTRGILLADYLKAIMLGPELAPQKGASLPADLNQEARTSTLYSQYCPGANAWLCRPADMPGSDLTFAFEAG